MHERCITKMCKCRCMKFLCIISDCPAGARKWHIPDFAMLLHSKTQPAKLPFAGCTSKMEASLRTSAHTGVQPRGSSWSPCRGRCQAQLFETKERYRCGLPPAGTHRPAFCAPILFFLFLRKKEKNRRGVRRSQLHSASAGAAKTPYPLAPSSFPKADRFAGSPFG